MNNDNQTLEIITVNGQEIGYDIHGDGDGPAIVLLTGWCQDHRLFDRIVGGLAKSHKVVRINWRGHTNPAISTEDFGAKEQAEDVISILNALNIDQVIPVSTSHGGWANMEITDKLGPIRAPRSIVIDWIMIEAGEEFIKDLQDIQHPDKWIDGRQSLFDIWQGISESGAIKNHLNSEMAAFGFDMWARSCRVIESSYNKWGSPMKRMAALDQERPIMHIYSQAPVSEYEEMQKKFIAEHPWFDFTLIEGLTHFPTIESPDEVVKTIHQFASQQTVKQS